MRHNSRIVANALQTMKQHAVPGVTTNDLNEIAEDYIRSQGAKPSFLGYIGYPASICASVNDEVVHGIPNDRPLEGGDILGIDVGANSDGFHGDGAITLPIGTISESAERLLAVTRQALDAGVNAAVPGERLGDISHAIQTVIEAAGFSVVRALVGHGIGREMHEAPQVANYGDPGRGARLKPGMTLALEPMVNVGSYEVELLEDQWTVVTVDGELSAHFEHTIAITEYGPIVLTVPDEEMKGP